MKQMTLHIPPEIHAEIMYHVHNSDVEISGLGRLVKTSDGNLMVSKVYMLEQENSPVTTDICPEALAKLQFESREDRGDLNFWWHSHVNMGCNWSGTDTDTFEEFGKHGMLVGTVFNKKGEHRSAIYQAGNDFFPFIWKDDIKTNFGYLPTQEQVDFWAKEHKKCKKKVYKSVSGSAFPSWTPNSGKGKSLPIAAKDSGNIADDIHEAMYMADDPNSKTATFSGEFLDDVIMECEGHVESSTPWDAIHNFDQFYWWDVYEYFYGEEPQEDEPVKNMYEQILAQPHLFSTMIYQKEQEELAENYIKANTADKAKAPKAAAPLNRQQRRAHLQGNK